MDRAAAGDMEDEDDVRFRHSGVAWSRTVVLLCSVLSEANED